MSDQELRRINDEIDAVAEAIYFALPSTGITVSDAREWADVEERVKDDMRRLAAVAIDKRDAQVRGASQDVALCPECASTKGEPETVIEEGEDSGDLCTHPFHDDEEAS